MYRSNNRETGYRPGEVSREKPKNNSEKLKGLLREIANSLNREAEESYGISGLLDDECQVLMTGYQEIYSQAFLEQSARDVREREIAFSGATNPNVQHNYRVQYQIEGQDNIIAKWKENKKKEKNSQMEMVVTALLHKVLGDRYFIVRTSEFDDYHNGIDNIIIDKQTGAVVCAFDEVHEGGVGDRTQKKQEKISKTAK